MDLGAFPLTKINTNKKPNTKTCKPFYCKYIYIYIYTRTNPSTIHLN